MAFPSVLDLALRVNELGRSSVTYETGLFERGSEDVKAVGNVTHVFVERKFKRPCTGGMPKGIRDGLTKAKL